MTTVTISYDLANATDSAADQLRGIGDGDPAAWDEILRRYGKLVATTVRGFRLQEADALDAIQMTWLRLAANAHQVRFPERLGGWLATTARRECLRILLRQRKVSSHPTDMPLNAIPEPSSLPPTNVQAWEQQHEVQRLLSRLSRLQQQVMAFTLDGYTPAEISSELEMTPSAVRSSLLRARRTLAAYLHPPGDVNPVGDA